MATDDARWGVIDDESIAQAAALIGQTLRRDRMRWNEAATPDAIRQFCEGVGDDNPLWCNPEYGKATRWGTQLASPSFLYSIDATIVAPKLPGVQWIYAGTRWRWYDVVRVDDVFDVDAKLTDVEEKTGRRFGLWVLQKGEIEFRRRDGTLVCLAEGRVARTPRRRRAAETSASASAAAPAGAESSSGSAGVGQDRPADDSLVSTTTKPARRGSEPRLWESVEKGDTLETMGIPLTLERIFAWYTGAQGALHYGGAHADGVRYRHRHDDYEINARTGAKDSAARGHFSSKEGRDVGMGGTYDVGLQRIAWVIAYVTDWMGDDAHLAEADIDVVAPNLVGDTTYVSGVVTDRWYDEHAFVAIAIVGRNQKDAITTKGHVVVALPSTEHGDVQLPLFGGDGRRWTSPPVRGG